MNKLKRLMPNDRIDLYGTLCLVNKCIECPHGMSLVKHGKYCAAAISNLFIDLRKMSTCCNPICCNPNLELLDSVDELDDEFPGVVGEDEEDADGHHQGRHDLKEGQPEPGTND